MYDRRPVCAGEDWSETGDRYNIDDVHSMLSDDLKALRDYSHKCKTLSDIYKKLAGPLMTPEIGTFAQHLEERVKEVGQIEALLKEAIPGCNKLEKEYHAFVDHWAANEEGMPSMPNSVQHLASFSHVADLAKKAMGIEDKIFEQDEDGYIDWTLEDFIGSGSKVLEVIESKSPDALQDTLSGSGSSVLQGYLADLADESTLESVLDDRRSELGVDDEE